VAAVYTRRLGALRHTEGNDQQLFAHPGSGTYILRDLLVSNLGVSGGYVHVYIRPATGSGLTLYINAQQAIASTRHEDMRQELVQGDEVRVATGVGTDFAILLTGYVFAD